MGGLIKKVHNGSVFLCVPCGHSVKSLTHMGDLILKVHNDSVFLILGCVRVCIHFTHMKRIVCDHRSKLDDTKHGNKFKFLSIHLIGSSAVKNARIQRRWTE